MSNYFSRRASHHGATSTTLAYPASAALPAVGPHPRLPSAPILTHPRPPKRCPPSASLALPAVGRSSVARRRPPQRCPPSASILA